MPRVLGFDPKNERTVFCTEEQIELILAYAKTASRSPHIYPFMLIGFSTGMRVEEILSIRIENIDFDRRMVHLPETKTGARDQPIPPGIADYLSQYRGQTGWLFPSPTSECGHVTNIKKSWVTVIREAGFDPRQVIRHTMRHSAATNLIRVTDQKTAQRITGHASYQSFKRYLNTNEEIVAAAMEKVDEIITKLHQD